MRLIKCNRCKKEKEIKAVKKSGYINLGMRNIASGELIVDHEFDDWDICDDCLMQIRDFVHMAPLKLKVDETLLTSTVMEKIKSEERMSEPDSRQGEEPSYIDVDESHGLAARPKRLKAGIHPKAELMKEMARSGASLTEIMEAAGCSEPTARKYMKEATE